ncbi:hypothetical protein COCVIDRAFT_39286 [Bipolaris victoriae FI3]|uniref:Uncharacterized protein n=1 Tax=Bipolaris victoriae (strain FI3) TaxID=930091 RepID=W7EHW5_BIPV3|nr:hypothetical protein COCVIDRAFT_39286 [Bipolaris victoriae FI3]
MGNGLLKAPCLKCSRHRKSKRSRVLVMEYEATTMPVGGEKTTSSCGMQGMWLGSKGEAVSWHPTDKAQPTASKRFPVLRWHGIYLGQASLSKEAEILF